MPAKAENGKRGAPAGNQNAKKHGFYSMVLDEVTWVWGVGLVRVT